MIQGMEPVFIQAFIPEFAIEAFDESILGGLAGLYQIQLHAMLIGPLIQCPAIKLWSLVRSDRFGVAPESGNLIQNPGDIMARDAEVGNQTSLLRTGRVSGSRGIMTPLRRLRRFTASSATR